MAEQNRIEYLDVCKGIGILLVVAGHSLLDEMVAASWGYQFLFNVLYSFHMPLFMVLSGIVFRLKIDRNTAQPLRYLKGRTRSVLIPFLVYTVLLYLVFAAANYLPGVGSVLQGSGRSLLSVKDYLVECVKGNNPYGIHMWFLYCLFVVSMLGLGLSMATKKLGKSARLAVFAALVLLLWIVRNALDIETVIIWKVMGVGGFFLLGVVWFDVQRLKGLPYVILSALVWGYVLYCAYASIRGIEEPVWQKVLSSVLCCVCVDNLLRLSGKIKGKAKQVLAKLGRESFAIYLLHQPFCVVLGMLLLKLGLPFVPVSLICFAASIAMPLAVKAVFSKFRPTRAFLRLLGMA